eukprot:1448719-Rhodomonas_salina.4
MLYTLFSIGQNRSAALSANTHPTRCPCMMLCLCYAMSGTDLAYGATAASQEPNAKPLSPTTSS